MKNVTLVTGASSGIGLALAKVFAAHGSDLVLVARNEQKLKEIAVDLEAKYKIETLIIAADLSKGDAVNKIYDPLRAENIEIETLVNNAGFAEYGAFSEVPLEKHLDEINLNIVALTALTGTFLPGMIRRKRGNILNVASTAAFQPGPLMAVYYASKAYVLSFSEALRKENQKHGIAITALCPGPTKTGFGAKSDLSKSRLLASTPMMSADQVASFAYDALQANKAIAIPGFLNKLLAFGTRLLPRTATTAISYWTLEQK